MRSTLIATATLLTAVATPVHAQSSSWAYVLDDQLTTHAIHITQADSLAGISGTNEQGLPVQFAPGQLLALWIDHTGMLPEGLDTDAYNEAVSIELTDGQQLALVVQPSSESELIIGTRLDADRSVSIPLDRVRTITRVPTNTSYTPGFNLFDDSVQDDAVRLDNNDLVLGFITHIGSSVEIETTSPNGQTVPRSFPLDRVHSILIQNPPVSTPGIYIITSLKERLRVREFSSNRSQELTATLDDPIHASLDTQQPLIAELVAVDRIIAGSHLVDLASAQTATITPTGDRDWAPIPTPDTSRGLGSLRTRARIDSPVSISWDLPSGSQRLTMDINPWSRPWTDNQVSIIAMDSANKPHTLWTRHFDSTDHPNETIVLDLPEGSTKLTFEIDPGANGPIQDQFFIGFPLILVDDSPEFQ